MYQNWTSTLYLTPETGLIGAENHGPKKVVLNIRVPNGTLEVTLDDESLLEIPEESAEIRKS